MDYHHPRYIKGRLITPKLITNQQSSISHVFLRVRMLEVITPVSPFPVYIV